MGTSGSLLRQQAWPKVTRSGGVAHLPGSPESPEKKQNFIPLRVLNPGVTLTNPVCDFDFERADIDLGRCIGRMPVVSNECVHGTSDTTGSLSRHRQHCQGLRAQLTSTLDTTGIRPMQPGPRCAPLEHDRQAAQPTWSTVYRTLDTTDSRLGRLCRGCALPEASCTAHYGCEPATLQGGVACRLGSSIIKTASPPKNAQLTSTLDTTGIRRMQPGPRCAPPWTRPANGPAHMVDGV